MNLHGNARLCPASRELLCRRVREDAWTVAEAASAAGVSERTAYRWLARFDAGEPMTDRSSRPGSCPNRTPVKVEIVIERLRRELPARDAGYYALMQIVGGVLGAIALAQDAYTEAQHG